MKKISYFVVLLASIFSLNMLVSAEKCEYNVGLEKLGSNSEQYNSFLDTPSVSGNDYMLLRAYAAKLYTNIDNADFAEVLSKIGGRLTWYSSPSTFYTQDKDHIANDMKLKYNTDGATLTYTFYDFGTYWGNENGDFVKKNARYNVFKNDEKLTRGTCPDAISFSVNYDEACTKDPTKCITLNKELYLSDYDYDYLKLIAAGNFSSATYEPTIILFNNANVKVNEKDEQYNANLLNAVACSLKTLSSGFATNSMSEIASIIDNAAKNPEYNIRNLYEKVATLSVSEAEDTIKKIKNGETISKYEEKMIYNYIMTLPYFEQSNAASALQLIKDDKEKLENFKTEYNNFEKCISYAYGTSEDAPKEAIAQYMQYDKNYQGLYVEPMINLLEIFNEDNIKAWYDSKKEIDYVQEKRNDERCAHVASSASKEECVKGLIQSDINNINCTDLIGKTTLTPAEQILKNSLNGLCTNPNDYNCYLTKCAEAKGKKEVTTGVSDLTSGNTDAQKKVQANINQFYENVIEHVGVRIESDICKFGVIAEYVTLLLNIIRVGGPVLVIILSMAEGIKTIASQKDEDNKKFYARLKTRMIAVVLLFLIPTIVYWLLDIVGIKSC